jgi:hypothetical protein
MKTILVINDHSSAAAHAAKLALTIAQKMNANLLLINTSTVPNTINAKDGVLIPEIKGNEFDEEHEIGSENNGVKFIDNNHPSFTPIVEVIDTALFSEDEFIAFINEHATWMIIKGIQGSVETAMRNDMNLYAVLNKIRCPLMLVPEKFEMKNFEQIVYTADLRYCRLQIVKYLKELAEAFSANLLIAHLSAKGLPDMEEKFAYAVFNEITSGPVKYDRLFFNNIREKNINKAIDVLINGMHTDLLAMVNHRFHFEEIVRRGIYHVIPENIKIPLLIFPY